MYFVARIIGGLLLVFAHVSCLFCLCIKNSIDRKKRKDPDLFSYIYAMLNKLQIGL